MSRNPQNSYGHDGRKMIFKVVDSDGDEEQIGRVKVQRIGYESSLGQDEGAWARPQGSVASAGDGGVGGMVTGVTNNSILTGYMAEGSQQPIFTGTLMGKDGDKHDLNKHSRDEKTGGGDDAYNGETKEYRGKSITVYARDEAPSPDGSKSSKDADEDPKKSYSIGREIYA